MTRDSGLLGVPSYDLHLARKVFCGRVSSDIQDFSLRSRQSMSCRAKRFLLHAAETARDVFFHFFTSRWIRSRDTRMCSRMLASRLEGYLRRAPSVRSLLLRCMVNIAHRIKRET